MTGVEQRVMDRLRANVRAAGIDADDDELEKVRAGGFLDAVMAFERLVGTFPVDLVPDYLRGTDPAAQASKQSDTDATNAPQTTSGGCVFGAPDDGLDDEPLAYASIADVAGMLRRGELSSVELTRMTLERISDRDPILNAFQAVTAEHAMTMARRADDEREAGIDLGPLHGVPIAIKDLIAMKGTVTTAGSAILAGWVTDHDAAVVERLEAAGAVVVGKTRLPEFAFSPTSANPHYRPTRNPWNLDYDTGGSSSGSGAAVANGLAYGALGSDTGGSVRIPAAYCGIVGLKPTHGLVSLHGAVTLSWSLDHVGPMTRTVADTALMLNVLAGHDHRDLRTRASVSVPDYTTALHAGVRGLRIGVLTDDGTGGPLASDEALDSWRHSLRILEEAGADLVEVAIPQLEALRIVNSVVVLVEATAFHEPNLASRYHDFGPFMRRRVLAAYALSPNAFSRANQARSFLRGEVERAIEDVDLLSTPAMPGAAPEIGSPPRNITFTGPFNSLGWPALVVPVSLGQNRLPLATQVIGRAWDESTVLRAGAALESARGRVA